MKTAMYEFSCPPAERLNAREQPAEKFRLIFGLVLIALEFSNLVQFAAFGSRDMFHTARPTVHMSAYTFQALAYLTIPVVAVLSPRSLGRLFHQPIFRWTAAAALLFAWGMVVRSFNPPAGYPQYLVIREFLLRLNALGFMLICVMMFEGDRVLRAARLAIALVTAAAVAVNVCEVMHLWIFSTARIGWNRAIGLQDDPNAAGMVIVFGCILGLAAVPRRLREAFIIVCLAGVLTTFSREAIAALGVVMLCACAGRTLAPSRLVFIGVAAVMLFIAFNLADTLEDEGVLSDQNVARLTLQVSDKSAKGHARVAEKTWDQFAAAPLLGNGFGTTAYWGDMQSHNLYLSFMADHGIIGVLLLPALVWCLAYPSWEFYGFAFAFLIWNMFNHNLFSNPFGLITLAVVANLQCQSRYLRAQRLIGWLRGIHPLPACGPNPPAAVAPYGYSDAARAYPQFPESAER